MTTRRHVEAAVIVSSVEIDRAVAGLSPVQLDEVRQAAHVEAARVIRAIAERAQ